MGSSPRADIFFGIYLGNEGSWHNDADWTTLPDWAGEYEDGFSDLIHHLAGVPPGAPYEDRKAAEEACPVCIIEGGSLTHGVTCASLAEALTAAVTVARLLAYAAMC